MERQCPEHGNTLKIGCLRNGCEQTFSCLICYRNHNEDHTEVIVLSEQDRTWLKPYEAELEKLTKDSLLHLSPNQHDIIHHNKELINKMIESLVWKLKQKGELLIEEMVKQMTEQQAIERISHCLKEKNEILQNINFMHDDTFDLVNEVKYFQEKVSPDTKKIIQFMKEEHIMWTINPSVISQTEQKLQKSIIESLSLDDLLSGNELEGSKSTIDFEQGFDMFSNEKEDEIFKLKKSFKLKCENLSKEINSLKTLLKTKEEQYEKTLAKKENRDNLLKEIKSIQSLFDAEKKSRKKIQSELAVIKSFYEDEKQSKTLILKSIVEFSFTYGCGLLCKINLEEGIYFCCDSHYTNTVCPVRGRGYCFKIIKLDQIKDKT